ncbi:phage tail protein [Rodentibacter myodis]|uniref:Phage tail fibre protein N-terminal domain-containing protein n=1 Tax=Rodentibacter myodis TaxID=1907939 RepID=A0A1V3JRV8_9PAST|nr:phage tail protein [Rodentibacter myodis]OOF59364.1 hypothetical protein BKL49_04630 [Rodentibacter myodis]
MASQYFALLTDYGTAAFAKVISSSQPLQLTTFAVGDGNGQTVTPTANRTSLVREKHRATVSAVTLSVDHSVIFVPRQQLTPKTITATTKMALMKAVTITK